MSQLSDHFRAMREAMLSRMYSLTEASSAEDFRHCYGSWWRYKVEVTAWANVHGLPGEAVQHFQEVFADPRWRHRRKLATKRHNQRPEVRAKRRKQARTYYRETLKAERSTPEMRAKLAEQRRARYAKRKTIAAVLEEVGS